MKKNYWLAALVFLVFSFFGILYLEFKEDNFYSAHSRLESSRERLLNSFPELSTIKIVFKPFASDEYFFASSVHSPWKNPRDRTYVILYKPELLTSNISDFALDGILAHELTHIADYVEMGLVDLTQLLIRYEYLGGPNFVKYFERQTDRKTVERGYAKNLIEYRNWLYSQLTESQQIKKRQEYMMPDEIEKMIASTD